MWWSSCSENTQRTNLRQLILQCSRLELAVTQGYLLEKLKENNVAKVSSFKLLTKENLLVCFH